MAVRRVPLMVLLAGMVVAAIALSGCGGGSSSGTASPAATSLDLLTTTPPGAGELDKVTWNLPYEPSSLDYAKSFDYAENTAIANMNENLLRLMPDFSIEPGLAESFTNPSPTTWVYKIRRGVSFWDGKPMTADDVVYSLQRNLDPDVGSFFSYYYANVERIEKTGDYEVTVTLTKPDMLFHEALATPAGAVTEKAYVEAKGADYGTPKGGAMGTGPFKLTMWQSGTSMALERNDKYWDTSLKPKVKSLELRFIADESTAINALRSGEIDGQYFYLPPAGLSQIASSGTSNVYFGQSLVFWSLLTVAKDGPFADPRVRQALLDATDRAAIAKVVFQDTATPARVLSPPSSWGYAKEIWQAAYDAVPAPAVDVAKAKQLIADAGATGKTVKLVAQGNSIVHSQTADILKAAGAQIGLSIEIEIIPVQRYGSLYWDTKAQAGIDAFLSTWYGNVADPLDLFATIGPGGANNYNDWDPPAVRAVLDRALGETDDIKRAELLVQVQQAMTADVVWLPLSYQSNILVMSKRLGGAVASFPYLYYPWAASIGGVK